MHFVTQFIVIERAKKILCKLVATVSLTWYHSVVPSA